MKNPFREEKNILNGRFLIITEENEFRMSHWVKGFGIMDNTNGRWILDLENSFHLDKYEENEKTLKIYFRVYPDGSLQYEVQIDPVNKTFSYKKQIIPLKKFLDTFKVPTPS